MGKPLLMIQGFERVEVWKIVELIKSMRGTEFFHGFHV